MTGGEAAEAEYSNGCVWGCLMLLAMAAAWWLLEDDFFTTLLHLAILVTALVQQRAQKGFFVPFRQEPLRRSANPVGFWLAFGFWAIFAAFVAYELWSAVTAGES